MNITHAGPADLDEILRLLPQLLEERMLPADACRRIFETIIEDTPHGSRGTVLIAKDGDTALGLISISYIPALRYAGGYAQIEELVVDAAGRGKGVGAALVDAAVAAAAARGSDEIGLYAREHNQPFYEKLGFTYVGPELRRKLT